MFSGAWWFDVIVDICFLTDIALSFRTAYVVDSAGQQNETVVTGNESAFVEVVMDGKAPTGANWISGFHNEGMEVNAHAPAICGKRLVAS